MTGFLASPIQINDTLAEIQERHGAVKELEKSVLELNQLFLDMAVLVEAQGEMLDNIEKQASRQPCPACAGRCISAFPPCLGLLPLPSKGEVYNPFSHAASAPLVRRRDILCL